MQDRWAVTVALMHSTRLKFMTCEDNICFPANLEILITICILFTQLFIILGYIFQKLWENCYLITYFPLQNKERKPFDKLKCKSLLRIDATDFLQFSAMGAFSCLQNIWYLLLNNTS